MRISRGFFLLAIIGAAALGYTAGQLRNFFPLSLSSGSVSPNPNLPSGDQYYVVMPNSDALIDHRKVSANPTKAEWQSTSMPMTKEQCEAQLRQHFEWRATVGGSDYGPERNLQIDVTNLRRCIRVDVWDPVEKYSPDPKDVFRP
jgi:hypothetical protein